MKKFFAMVALAAMTLTASAQVFVGGQVGLWRDYDANKTNATIKPDVGYNLSDKWAVGTVIGWDYAYKEGAKANGFEIAPYARYTAAKLGPVSVFLDGGLGFYTYKVKGVGSSENAWEVGIKPGVSVGLTEKLSFESHFGFLGYRDADPTPIYGDNGLGFNLDGSTITFGLYYNF